MKVITLYKKLSGVHAPLPVLGRKWISCDAWPVYRQTQRRSMYYVHVVDVLYIIKRLLLPWKQLNGLQLGNVIIFTSQKLQHHKPQFYLARHVTSRQDSTRRTCRACRAVLYQHGRRRTSYSARLYKFSRFYALTYTNPIYSV